LLSADASTSSITLPINTIGIMMFSRIPPTRKMETGPKLSEGKKVSHSKFGAGIIKEKLGRDVFRVTFKDHITKNIHYDFLSLI
jgi:hypothetical protein